MVPPAYTQQSDAEPEAAVALLVSRPTDSLLLQRRAEHPADPWSGHWALPGGRIDRVDADAQAAARRELCEEAGIDLGGRPADAALPQRLAGRHVGRPILVAPFLWYVPAELPTRPEPGEVAELHWCPIDHLLDHGNRGEAALAPVGDELFPYILVGSTPLWGFTYGVLTAWLAEWEGGGQAPKV